MRERFPQWWSPGFFVLAAAAFLLVFLRERTRTDSGRLSGKNTGRRVVWFRIKKESPRRADGGRIERGNDGEESFSGNDPSRLEGSGRIKGGAMKAQGNYSIFKASMQSGGGVIRLVFLPVQGPGLFAVSAVGSLWFMVVHRGSNYPAEARPVAGISSAGPEKKTAAAASDYIKTSPRFQDSGRGEALSADILREKSYHFPTVSAS